MDAEAISVVVIVFLVEIVVSSITARRFNGISIRPRSGGSGGGGSGGIISISLILIGLTYVENNWGIISDTHLIKWLLYFD